MGSVGWRSCTRGAVAIGHVLRATLNVLPQIAQEGGQPHLVPGLLDGLLEALVLRLSSRKA